VEKFYYTAVSNSEKKRITGGISAEDEKDARKVLNKIGMAILTIAKQKPSEWDDAHAYEFEVFDKAGKIIVGEFMAESDDEVFARLTEEFGFEKVSYIYSITASEEEKIKAKEKSVREILERKVKRDAEKKEEEMRTFSGSLKALATMDITKKKSGEEEDEEEMKHKLEENLHKFAAKDEDLTKKTEADFAKTPEQEKAKNMSEALNKNIPGNEDDAEETVSKKGAAADSNKQGKGLEGKLKDFFGRLPRRAAEFYYYLTEMVVPSKGKTRKDGWEDMKKSFFPSLLKKKDPVQIEKERSESVLKRKAIFERFWISMEEIIDVLAAAFIVYLTIGTLALYVEIPRVSELAEQTLRGNYTIPFFTGTLIFLRILFFIREKLTSWSPIRTFLLFLVGGVIIAFAGMNLL